MPVPIESINLPWYHVVQLPTNPLYLLSFNPNFPKLSTHISLVEFEKCIRIEVYKV